MSASSRLHGRYELGQRFAERGALARYLSLDHGTAASKPVPVILVRASVNPSVEAVVDAPEQQTPVVAPPVEAGSPDPATSPTPTVPEAEPVQDSPMRDTAPIVSPGAGPSHETSGMPTAEAIPLLPGWPSISWERSLLERVGQQTFPQVIDYFVEDGFENLVEEVPAGQMLWDAWDDPEIDAFQRFGWLKQIADALRALHGMNAVLEALRPDIVVVTPAGEARLTDLSDLLPLPLPDDPPLRASLYTAPELMAVSARADARADLYSFGAMLYALNVGRELTEMDFDRPGTPKPFIPCFPDIHPLFGRLVSKTFQRDPALRFPTDEAVKEDPTGFAELMRTLETCRRTFDNVRLEIASWTTTGMVRSGNEDAFALVHTVESRQDDLEESALVLLADGMGGYEAGEIAAALAIQSLRENLLQQSPFRALAGDSPFPSEPSRGGESSPAPFDVEACKQILMAALKDANKHVFAASRSGAGRQGMGCTAEAVFVNGQHVVVGHVGDSRTYHLHEGRLIQLTRDHTLVGRFVELGMLTPEEAETHPRRNELQQAIGGQPDVEPGLYHGRMKPGDWVVVCSDGVTNHVTPIDLKEMLQSEAQSAEMAARRLINLVNIEGATDNATVVVIRAT